MRKWEWKIAKMLSRCRMQELDYFWLRVLDRFLLDWHQRRSWTFPAFIRLLFLWNTGLSIEGLRASRPYVTISWRFSKLLRIRWNLACRLLFCEKMSLQFFFHERGNKASNTFLKVHISADSEQLGKSLGNSHKGPACTELLN